MKNKRGWQVICQMNATAQAQRPEMDHPVLTWFSEIEAESFSDWKTYEFADISLSGWPALNLDYVAQFIQDTDDDDGIWYTDFCRWAGLKEMTAW
jgi:hypothetical protein